MWLWKDCLIDSLGNGGPALVLIDNGNACPNARAKCEVDSEHPLYEADCQAVSEVEQEADRYAVYPQQI